MALLARYSVADNKYSPRRSLDFNGYGGHRNNSPLRESASRDALYNRLEIDYLKQKL